MKAFKPDGLPYEDQRGLRRKIRSPWRRALARYVDRAFNGGLYDLNRRTRAFLEPNPKAMVLDIGTGDGELLLWWSRTIGSRDLHAIDAVPNAHRERIHTVEGSIEDRWPFESNRFDVIISSQNIEHIIDTPLYMSECHRVLKPEGYMILLTENLASWANIFATVMGWMPFSFTNMFGYPLGNRLIWHDGLPKEEFGRFYERKLWGCLGHQRLFTLFALRQLGEKHGFCHEAAFGEGYLPMWGWLSRMASRLDARHAQFIGVKLRKPRAGPPAAGFPAHG